MIYLVENIHPAGIRLLRQACFEVNISSSPSEDSILEGVKEAEAIIIRSQGTLTKKIIERCPKLKCIGRYGVGVDNIDVETANRLRIPIVFAPRINSKAVAEHVFMFILAIDRKLVLLNRLMREGKWKELRNLHFCSLPEKVLGIVGIGAIGFDVARIANFFSMKILGFDPYLSKEELSKRGVVPVDWETLLKESDIISVHVPLNAKTRKLIGEKEFNLMKKGVILINTARGGIVDEGALVKALEEGRVSTAALDVFEEEPLGQDHPLLSFENVLVTPHSAGLTSEVLKNLATTVCSGVIKVLKGEKLDNVFNPEVFE